MKILSGIANGQVLQRLGSRGATAKIEGVCEKSGTINATILQGAQPLKGWKKKTVGKAARGKFSVILKDVPAGGPYQLRLENGGDAVEIATFFVGDVWVLAGQSNMEGVGNLTGAAKSHPLIRAFSMRREWRLATDPLHVMPESPDVCHHGGVQFTREQGEERRKISFKGTGVGIFFSREMMKRSAVPQGLICTAHGGTSMEQWDPERKKLRGESLYYSMLESVRATGQPVSGVLWYQGESDTDAVAAPLYTKRMQKLVAATRGDFKLAKLPWIIVQLARLFNGEPNHPLWNSIQEQQRLLPDKIKYFETVPAIDLPMDDPIHVGAAGFVILGQRLARVADRLVYGNRKEKRPPQLGRIRLFSEKPKGRMGMTQGVEVTFDEVALPLQSIGEPEGFTLVNLAGKSMPLIYKTTFHGNRVRLHLNAVVPVDARLSYGHGVVPHCNITDARGFPLPVFGPSAIERPPSGNMLPYLIEWKKSEVIATTEPLDKIPFPGNELLNPVVKKYGENGFASGLDGFINEHPAWVKKSGHAYFQAKLTLGEPMKLLFLMGYDGPFKLWLDGKSFFTDMGGVNPCVADKGKKAVELGKGSHDVRVGMDLADGRAWGFFLRFKRQDVSPTQARSGKFVKPVYSV